MTPSHFLKAPGKGGFGIPAPNIYTAWQKRRSVTVAATALLSKKKPKMKQRCRWTAYSCSCGIIRTILVGQLYIMISSCLKSHSLNFWTEYVVLPHDVAKSSLF